MAERPDRPLSPHMTVWRWQMNAITSIFVRVTGNGLIVTTLLVVWWLVAAATGPGAFATADAVLRSWFGDLVLFLSVWALWYHLLGGLRHLIWDFGYGVDIEHATVMGYGMIIGSVLLTIFTAIVV